MKNLLRNQFIYLWIIFLFIGNCKNNIYFGNHKFIVLEWSNNKIYDINISGQLSYIDPYNKS